MPLTVSPASTIYSIILLRGPSLAASSEMVVATRAVSSRVVFTVLLIFGSSMFIRA